MFSKEILKVEDYITDAFSNKFPGYSFIHSILVTDSKKWLTTKYLYYRYGNSDKYIIDIACPGILHKYWVNSTKWVKCWMLPSITCDN